MPGHDVYSYGVVASSTQYVLGGAFPSVEGYGELVGTHYITGGEAANSSIVLARLGASVMLDGNWLGEDAGGKRTRELLSGAGIDVTRLAPRSGYTGVQEVVFAAEGKRTIFGTYGALQENEEWNQPVVDDITAAKVVCLDPFFKAPAMKVAEVASGAGIPVVTVDCRHDDPLLPHVSALIVAESFIRDNYPDKDTMALLSQYLEAAGGLVIFTFGDAPMLYARRGNDTKSVFPYTVNPVDTTGGGDSFRAGIVYGYLQGWDDETMIDYASAVAAINCTRSPGVLNSPNADEVTRFISTNGKEGDAA